jgi:class 3 adenylate cyclase
MHLRSILLIWLIATVGCLLRAQAPGKITVVIDSIEAQLPTMPSDTNKVHALNRLAFEYNSVSPYDGIRYALEGLSLAEMIGFKKGMARANSSLGANYFSLSDYPNAYQYWLRALEINREIGNTMGEVNHLHNIGMVFYTQKNYESALQYYTQALELSQRMGNKKFATHSYTAMGNIYLAQRNFPSSLEYHTKSLVIDRELDNRKAYSSDLLNVGNVYLELRNFEEAEKNIQEGLSIKHVIGDKNGLTRAYQLLGRLLLERSESQEDRLHALTYLDSAIVLGNTIGFLENVQLSYQLRSKLYEELGMYRDALESAHAYHDTKDSIYSVTKQTEIFNLDKKATRAEQEKKDALAAQELERQKLLRNVFIGGFSVLAILAVIIILQRNRIAKARRISENLLLNILPQEVADELKEKGSARAKRFDEATVLFTDFKGFTALSEKLTPEELVEEINTCFSAFDLIMKTRGVEKIKTIGDAYMAVGGVPTPTKDHAAAVVQAALDIQSFMIDYQNKRKEEGKEYFEIRIGIHTGPLVAGVVGLNKFAYDIWGDTVNTASRMESSGEPGKVNISGSTYLHVQNKFTTTYRGKIQAKGKGEIDMYFLGDRL